VVPKDLIGYFTASAQIAGSLIGLLFVSISLRYEAILGKSAEFRSRAIAGAAFTGLVNVLTISIWALVPGGGLGFPVAISGVICLVHTLRLHAFKHRAIDASLASFLLSLGVYFAQIVEGVWLIARPSENEIVFILAYTLFGAMALSLKRAWTLLQPGGGGDKTSLSAAPLALPPEPTKPSQPTTSAELTGKVG
jgi:hypothetical protein